MYKVLDCSHLTSQIRGEAGGGVEVTPNQRILYTKILERKTTCWLHIEPQVKELYYVPTAPVEHYRSPLWSLTIGQTLPGIVFFLLFYDGM